MNTFFFVRYFVERRSLNIMRAVVLFLFSSLWSCGSDDDDILVNGSDHGLYRDARFSQVDVQTVTYGEGNLQMDVYMPKGDHSTARPLIIFAHGGAFIGGSRDLPDMQRLCNSFAKRGYVAASISYRLMLNPQVFDDSLEVLSVVMKAMHDGKAAVRFFRKSVVEDNNPFGVDTNYIFAAGNSAGAVLMLHLAYMRDLQQIPTHLRVVLDGEGGLEGNQGNQGYSSRVHAVVNLAGAIHQLSFIQSSGVPIVSAHGDQDQTVPFNCGAVLQSFPNPEMRNRLCGSWAIHQRATDINLLNDLLVFEGDGHCPWITGAGVPTQKMDDVESFIIDFLYQSFFKVKNL